MKKLLSLFAILSVLASCQTEPVKTGDSPFANDEQRPTEAMSPKPITASGFLSE